MLPVRIIFLAWCATIIANAARRSEIVAGSMSDMLSSEEASLMETSDALNNEALVDVSDELRNEEAVNATAPVCGSTPQAKDYFFDLPGGTVDNSAAVRLIRNPSDPWLEVSRGAIWNVKAEVDARGRIVPSTILFEPRDKLDQHKRPQQYNLKKDLVYLKKRIENGVMWVEVNLKGCSAGPAAGPVRPTRATEKEPPKEGPAATPPLETLTDDNGPKGNGGTGKAKGRGKSRPAKGGGKSKGKGSTRKGGSRKGGTRKGSGKRKGGSKRRGGSKRSLLEVDSSSMNDNDAYDESVEDYGALLEEEDAAWIDDEDAYVESFDEDESLLEEDATFMDGAHVGSLEDDASYLEEDSAWIDENGAFAESDEHEYSLLEEDSAWIGDSNAHVELFEDEAENATSIGDGDDAGDGAGDAAGDGDTEEASTSSNHIPALVELYEDADESTDSAKGKGSRGSRRGSKGKSKGKGKSTGKSNGKKGSNGKRGSIRKGAAKAKGPGSIRPPPAAAAGGPTRPDRAQANAAECKPLTFAHGTFYPQKAVKKALSKELKKGKTGGWIKPSQTVQNISMSPSLGRGIFGTLGMATLGALAVFPVAWVGHETGLTAGPVGAGVGAVASAGVAMYRSWRNREKSASEKLYEKIYCLTKVKTCNGEACFKTCSDQEGNEVIVPTHSEPGDDIRC